MTRRGRLQPFKLLIITTNPLQIQKVQRRGGTVQLDPENLERDLPHNTANNARQAIQEALRKSSISMEELGSRSVRLDIDALEPNFELEPWDPGDFTLHEEQLGSLGDS
jgi:hypothetical protein